MATQPPPPQATTTADASSSSPPSLLVQHAERAPPLGALLAAEVAGVALETKVDPKLVKGAEPVLVLPGGSGKLEGLAAISRYIAKVAPQESGLYPSSSVADSVRTDSFVDFSASQLKNGPGLESALESLDAFLALRTRLVGDDAPADESGASSSSSSHSSLTIADFAAWGALQSSGLWTKLRKKFPHVARWHALVGATPGASELAERHGLAFKSAFQLARERGAAGLGGGDTGSFDIGLPNAKKGAVVTRFPPEPSGYLHVGHAKAALLNDFFAKHYEGRMILRFDDTNPEKEDTEFVDAILADLKTLGVEYCKLTYTSDYFPQLLELGERLLKAGLAYADDTPMEQMQRERREKVESRCRSRSVEENLAVWKEMVAGSETGKKNCIRFKMDMQSANGTLRDPVAYRCNDTPHWRTGDKYKVYPTYDCACPFVDSLEGVTHALRTSEYKDREEQTKWALRLEQQVWNDGTREPLPGFEIWDYSRLAFAGTVMSKRKLLWFVQSGRVAGWDDARFPTVRGVIRRGLTVKALRDFILSQGASKNVTLQEFDKLWALNRAIIDPVAPRHVAVRSRGKVRVSLEGAPAPGSAGAVVDVPRHKKNPTLGTKKSYRTPSIWLDASDAAAVSKGEEVTLMDWGNAYIDEVDLAAGAGKGRLHPEGSVKTTRLKLTWLPAADAGDSSVPALTPLTLVDHGDLLTKKKLEEGENTVDFANPCSRWEEAAVGDAGIRSLKNGDVVQLERMGFYRVDSAFDESSNSPAVMIRIPDGKKGPAPPKECLEKGMAEEAARRANEAPEEVEVEAPAAV